MPAPISPKILIIDDHFEVANMHSAFLKELGYSHVSETDSTKVISILANDPSINLVLSDIRMPNIDGLELLLMIKSKFPSVGVIFITVISDIQEAVKATKMGAFNYLLKPIQKERLSSVIKTYFECLPKHLMADSRFHAYITQDQKFSDIFQRVAAFSNADVPILIEGETGTGKDLIAQIAHSVGNNSNGPYVAVNVAAISENLFESELFGHVKGAFTGAYKDHKGFVEMAENGTLFLDEIGELNYDHQKKLLRLLQSKKYTRVGDSNESKMNCKIILATNKNIKEDVSNKKFREDLYYRIASHIIHLPPLRERKGDIELLANYFLRKYVSQYGRTITNFSDESLLALKNYNYPGNIRELEGIISSSILLEQSNLVTQDSLPYHLKYSNVEMPDLENAKFTAIKKTLAEFNGNQTKAAQKLGIARGTLNKLIQDYKKQGLDIS